MKITMDTIGTIEKTKMQRNKSWIQVFCATLSVALLGSVVGCKQNMSALQADSKVIRIGEVGSMTGSDATFGISTHRGISLAIAEINAAGGIRGKKVELVSLDDQGKASEAVLAMNKLIQQEHVSAILGEVASSLSLAMAPIAQKFKVPMITPSSINSKVTQQGDFIFRVCFLDTFQSQVMARFALQNLKARKAAILRDVKSDYSQDSSKIFIELFKKGGGEIVVDQSYSAGDIDFKSQLTAIRAAEPDLILVPGYYTEIGLIARQSRELGISAPLLGGDGWDSPQLNEIGGAALKGSYFVSHFAQDDPLPRIQNFITQYRSAYGGQSPDGLSALAFDAALVLADSMRRAGSESSDDLRMALGNTKDFQGVTGKITIDSDRNAVKPAVVFEIGDGGRIKSAAAMR